MNAGIFVYYGLTAAQAEARDLKRFTDVSELAQKTSLIGIVQHVNRCEHGEGYYASDWYDSDRTVATYFNGKLR